MKHFVPGGSYWKRWLLVCALMGLGLGSALAQDSVKERKLGFRLGYGRLLVRDELESIRNFRGGGIPVSINYSSSNERSSWSIEAAHVNAGMGAKTSAMTMDFLGGALNVQYLRAFSGNAAIAWKYGIGLRNQFVTRTYQFNSPLAGQDPFTGEFFSAPVALIAAAKQWPSGVRLSWRLGCSPMAYLISRDFHPIRGFQRFSDIPRGFEGTPSFFEADSELRLRLNLGEDAEFLAIYSWRYLQYSRSYVYRAAMQYFGIGINVTLSK